MPEYQCSPIWELKHDGLVNLSLNELTVTKELKRDIQSWNSVFEETYDSSYPPNSRFPNKRSLEQFDKEGRTLWLRLQKELGAGIEVEFFSVAEQRLLKSS
jgi:abortive infection bacteriophage resistance protein